VKLPLDGDNCNEGDGKENYDEHDTPVRYKDNVPEFQMK